MWITLLLGACSPDPAATPSDGAAPGVATGTPTATDVSDRRLEPERIDLAFETVFDGLASPLLLTHSGDGSQRLFVVEQGGQILVGERGGELETFLDVSELIVSGGEQGLLGLAFHPRFENNGRFFVNYTDTNGDTVVAEYERATETRADPASARTLLQIDQPFANHNGGHLAFGPDGFLYIATGDGGAAEDPRGFAQNLSTLLGKILRIDVDSKSQDRPYGIPPDNPFAGDTLPRPEIWAYGLRNPWRFSFDRSTGKMWIGDVGQSEFEEIDVALADPAEAINFGWDIMEGPECMQPAASRTRPSCDKEGLELPVAGYGPDLGCSVTGGYVYRGEDYPDMQGAYFFSDYCSGRIWVLDASDPGSGNTELIDTDFSVSSFGEDERGELYLTDFAAGAVVRLTDRDR